jgi:hypothetical protein
MEDGSVAVLTYPTEKVMAGILPDNDDWKYEYSLVLNKSQGVLEKVVQDKLRKDNSAFVNYVDMTKSLTEGRYFDFIDAKINSNIPFQMSIYQSGEEIRGSCYYPGEGRDSKFKGKAGKKDIILYEYDAAGNNIGKFQGKNAGGGLEGTWISADGQKSYPFKLNGCNIPQPTEYGKRYSNAVACSDQDVDNFVDKVQGYIKNGNKEQLAELVSYPIEVKIDEKFTNLQNKDAFIKNYDKIFDARSKRIISDESPRYLYSYKGGIRFGAGYLWIDDPARPGELRIISIGKV